MRKYMLSFLFFFSLLATYAQELQVEAEVENPSNVINNGFVQLQVSGGTPPYEYKWSSQSTPLESSRAEGLVEGVPYNVTVTDAAGNSVSKEYTVPAEDITEHFNGTFAPIVESMGSVLFWDPFSAIGIYDPVVYADYKRVPAPEWSATIDAKFILQEWLQPEGTLVEEGDPIAVVSKNGEEIIAKANAAGELRYLVQEGGVIYNSENKEHVIEQGAQYLAAIDYDEPQPLTHPNGDFQQKDIPFIVIWLVLGALFFTIRMGFINIRGFKHALDLAKGKHDDPNAPGQVTHFQALATAVSGTVGLGNIAGVAVAMSLGGGNMFQANQSFVILAGEFPALVGNGFLFGVVVAILVGVVIIGGISSIAKVTGKIVPIMAAVYILGALVVIGVNIANIGPAFAAIWDGAFNPSALKGGIIGVLIVGFQRAAFSNEAGVGSAAIAHSAAKTSHPPSEGFVALLEPFIDTIVVCTLTALVLIFTGMHEVEGVGGVELTSSAFGSVISWFPYVLATAVFLFAFSTMISWSYYGMRAWTYLFGKSKKMEIIYKALFLVFVVVGASVSLGAVLEFSDMMILAMSFPNIIGLYLMSGEVKRDLEEYRRKLKAGELFHKPEKERVRNAS